MKNPVYYREVIRSMRAPRMILSIFIFNMLLFIVGMFSLFYASVGSGTEEHVDYDAVLQLYRLIAFFLFGLMAIMMPVITSGSISGERERNTFDILLSTGINEYYIIFGKLTAAISIIMTLMISTLPVLSLVFVYGGIRFLGLIKLLLVLIAEAFYIGSICLVFSSFARTQTFSLICSFAVILSITLGTYFGVYMLSEPAGEIAGVLSPVLYLNPMLTFIIFIFEQVGDVGTAASLLEQLCIKRSSIIGTHFIKSSIVLQIVVSLILLAVCEKFLEGKRFVKSVSDD